MEPRTTIDLGDHKLSARLWRPFDFTSVAHERRRFAVSFKGEGGEKLSADLHNTTEGEKGLVRNKPVSSENSRLAAARGSSGSLYSPFGIVQNLGFYLPTRGLQDGPETLPDHSIVRLYIINPALRFIKLLPVGLRVSP